MYGGFIWEDACWWGLAALGYLVILGVLLSRTRGRGAIRGILVGLPLVGGWLIFLACTVGAASPTLQYNCGDEGARDLFWLWAGAWDKIVLGTALACVASPFLLGRLLPRSGISVLAAALGSFGNGFACLLAFQNFPSV